MRAIALTWQAAWLEALANRRSFWSQLGFMAANDVVWVVFWQLFFRRVGTIRGWDADQVMVLLAILTTSVGWVLGAMANARHIGHMAASGQLDAALSLPLPTLPYLLARRVDAANVGDVVFGLTLFVWLGAPTPQRFVVFVLGVGCASAVFLGFLVLLGSIAFYLGPNPASDLGLNALVLFSSYPVDIFSGITKVLLYGVVPAGFMTALPTSLVEHFDPARAAALVAAGVGIATAGWLSFNAGLRRYTSGALWTQA
jgi:ABC-2 type transport system permease protein